MTAKITSLTKAQVERIPEFRDSWLRVGLSTERADHPLGLTNNPEWAQSRRRREALYLAERARRNEPEPHLNDGLIAVLAGVGAAVALIGGMIGALFQVMP